VASSLRKRGVAEIVAAKPNLGEGDLTRNGSANQQSAARRAFKGGRALL